MKSYKTLVRLRDNVIIHDNLQTANNMPYIAQMLKKGEYKYMHLTSDERSRMPVLALDEK